MKDFILKAVSGIETAFDKTFFIIKKKINRIGPLVILPYDGFGNHKTIYITGRLLEDEGLAHPQEGASIWTNMVTMLKRFESDEIPHARIQAVFQNQQQVVTTDSEGYFQVEFSVKDTLPSNQVWHLVHFTLLDQIVKGQQEVKATGRVLIPPRTRQFGVISDVDDTIIVSRATDLTQKLKLMFLQNAKSRMPFEGVATFYRALQEGNDGQHYNPIFYISSSSWNLYDLLTHFCEVNEIPKGPFLLRDMGIDKTTFIKSGHSEHKAEKVKRIFHMYPHLPFILIGDSGQKDAEIYEQVARQYPDQVLAIYIRDVAEDKGDKKVRKIAQQLQSHDIEMLLCQDTHEAARHAVQRGFIQEKTLHAIASQPK